MYHKTDCNGVGMAPTRNASEIWATCGSKRNSVASIILVSNVLPLMEKCGSYMETGAEMGFSAPELLEAHYQLALCTLYLEKMKVKGQVKNAASNQCNLDKVLTHYTRGVAAEQDFPWIEFRCPPVKTPVKLLVEQKIEELEVSVKNIPVQNLPPSKASKKMERSCFGPLLDQFFKFPTSSFPLKRTEFQYKRVFTEFRTFFKGVCELETSSSSASSQQLKQLPEFLNLPGSPSNGTNVVIESSLVGCFEIVEPVLPFRITEFSTQGLKMDKILAFAVVQDDSGVALNLQLTMNYRGDEDDDDVGTVPVGALGKGARIIVNRPCIRLDPDGGTSLLVKDAEAQIFQLPLISKHTKEQEQQRSRASGGQVTDTHKKMWIL